MKKFLFCALAFGMVACAKDATDEVPGVGTGETEVNYLSVSLSTTLGTRAGNTYEDDYADGEGLENTVNSVRFYFFSNGAPSAVLAGKSYQDWTPGGDTFPTTDPDESDTPNVEKVLQATIILETEAGASIPDEVIAVLNPNDAVDELGNTPSKSRVLEYAADLTEGFVMTNSVYLDGEVKNANSLAGYLKPTRQEALDNPVTVYVERVVAKVTMTVAIADEKKEGDLYDTGIANPNKENENIYVQFTGWNTTATANKSFLVKSIDAGWDNSLSDNNLFKTATEPWNWAQYFRSFWAINPTGVDYLYGPFDKATTEDKLYPEYEGESEDFEVINPANGIAVGTAGYVAENAGVSAVAAAQARPTQVIIAAQLVNKDGTTLELAEYAGTKMSVAQLKTAYLQSLQNTNKVFYREMTEEELQAANAAAKQENPDAQEITEGYKSVTVDDIDFKTAWQAGEDVGAYNKKGRYYVYAQLTDAAAAKTWYNSDATGTKESEENKVDADAVLKSLGHSKIWKDGKTYYFFDIRHLANPVISVAKPTLPDDASEEQIEQFQQELAAYNAAVAEAQGTPGYYGVVRNHVYQTKINTLFGLGTPVFDPSEVIYPEVPTEELVYLAAEIKILAWRIVNQDVDLEWK